MIRNETIYFIPNYDEPIKVMTEAKDLAIMFDYEFNFKCQMKKAVKKANNKISWVLRTFSSHKKYLMRTLWKLFIVSYFDYGNVVWAKTKS